MVLEAIREPRDPSALTSVSRVASTQMSSPRAWTPYDTGVLLRLLQEYY
jgi:hypothetical protein